MYTRTQAHMHRRRHVHRYTPVLTYRRIHTCITRTYIHTYTRIYLHTHIHPCMHAFIHIIYIHTCNIHACIHTYIHTDIQTDRQTQTYIDRCHFFKHHLAFSNAIFHILFDPSPPPLFFLPAR